MYITELKAYLQSVYDAELMGDVVLQVQYQWLPLAVPTLQPELQCPVEQWRTCLPCSLDDQHPARIHTSSCLLVHPSAAQDLATEHCLAYTVRLLDIMCDRCGNGVAIAVRGPDVHERSLLRLCSLAALVHPQPLSWVHTPHACDSKLTAPACAAPRTACRPKAEASGSYSVMELAASTLAMFAARPAALPALLAASALSVMVRAMSPLYPATVVTHLANALGSMAGSLDARLALRAAGGVGALVRLLRSDVDGSVQSAAASALSLLAARDVVIQDSVRYLGGVDSLVALLASSDSYLAEVRALGVVVQGARSACSEVSTHRACQDLPKEQQKSPRMPRRGGGRQRCGGEHGPAQLEIRSSTTGNKLSALCTHSSCL